MEDRRSRRTKNIFKTHFISLVKEKGYKMVTVTDLVQRADYNRSTFYEYYLDKEDFANQLVNEKLTLLREAFIQPFNIKQSVQYNSIDNDKQNTFFQHIYENRDFYQLLVVSDTIPNLNDRFLEEFKLIFSNIQYFDSEGKSIEIKQYNSYKMYGSYGVLLEWIESEFNESIEEISTNLLSIFKTVSTSFRFKNLNKDK